MNHQLLKTYKSEPITNIGGKAYHLNALDQLGLPVPKWIVIPASILEEQLKDTTSIENIESASVPQQLLSEIKDYFHPIDTNQTFAVRSSAIDEDGKEHSFAGLYASLLHVSLDGLQEAIKQVWKSLFSSQVVAYRKKHHLPKQTKIAVVIQEMISSEIAGVAFGQHPVNHAPDTKVISAVYGLGEGLVSGILNADTFTLSPSKTTNEVVAKEWKFCYSALSQQIEKVEVEKNKQLQPTLRPEQLDALSQILNQLHRHFGAPQDIEFAYYKSQLYLLQSRAITNLPKGEYTLWDNSNIVESYPGITTPLTFSFILKMYERVYLQFVQLMGAREKEIVPYHSVFENTLGLVRGRVYYNLLSWYKNASYGSRILHQCFFYGKYDGSKRTF